MVKKKKIALVVFSIVAIIIAIIVIHNFKAISAFINHNIGVYGYPFVFASAFVTDLIFQPIGPEVPAVFALVFGLNKFLIFFLVILGSFLASMIDYYIGKRFLSNKILVYCSLKSRIKYCKLFDDYGKWSLLIAAISPVPYVVFCWLSGAFDMPLKDYATYGLLPRAIRIFILLFFFSSIISLFIGG